MCLGPYFTCKQGDTENDSRYLEHYKNAVKGIKSFKITIDANESIIAQEFGDISSKLAQEKIQWRKKNSPDS